MDKRDFIVIGFLASSFVILSLPIMAASAFYPPLPWSYYLHSVDTVLPSEYLFGLLLLFLLLISIIIIQIFQIRHGYLQIPLTKTFNNVHYTLDLILLIAANFLILLAYISPKSEMQSSVLILFSFSFFFTALLLTAFLPNEIGRHDLVRSLTLPNVINTQRLANYLECTSNAMFIPFKEDAKWRVYQLNSRIDEKPRCDIDSNSIVHYSDNDIHGLLTVPAAYPFLESLEDTRGLRFRNGHEEFVRAIRYVLSDILEIADRVDVLSHDSVTSVKIRHSGSFQYCRRIQENNSIDCRVSPCFTCSCIGCILTRSIEKPFIITDVTLDESTDSITISLTQCRDEDIHVSDGKNIMIPQEDQNETDL